jgi:hypothetical protein
VGRETKGRVEKGRGEGVRRAKKEGRERGTVLSRFFRTER